MEQREGTYPYTESVKKGLQVGVEVPLAFFKPIYKELKPYGEMMIRYQFDSRMHRKRGV